MKIRIKGNSLRYRLTRPEVDRVAATGFIEEKIDFGPAALYYALRSTDQDQMHVSFTDNRITLYLPATMIREWIGTDRVGFENRMEYAGTGKTLTLLVEKDFTCMDKVDEDQSDQYPNPLKSFYDQ
jgi:hypothetical protein